MCVLPHGIAHVTARDVFIIDEIPTGFDDSIDYVDKPQDTVSCGNEAQYRNASEQNTQMNLLLLYIGMALSSVGMILVAMGTGDRDRMRGFLSSHLKMVGPVMIITGGILCIARIAFMFKPGKKLEENEKSQTDAEENP